MEPINKTIWFFGLSGSGKTTLSKALSVDFKKKGLRHILLDGDIIRKGINKNLSFETHDRRENVRRIAEICKLMLQVEVIPIVAAITPFQADRDMVEDVIGKEHLLWAFVKCPLKVCEQRDPKGLYHLARKGTIKSFTGISDPFEVPTEKILTITTEKDTLKDCLEKLLLNLNQENHEIKRR